MKLLFSLLLIALVGCVPQSSKIPIGNGEPSSESSQDQSDDQIAESDDGSESQVTPGQPSSPLVSLEQEIQTSIKSAGFKGYVSIRHKGSTVFSKSFESKATATSRYPIASLSKAFGAYLVLKLVEKGVLSLDQPMGSLLSGGPSYWDPMTIRHFLNHTSGLPNYTEHPNYLEIFSKEMTYKQAMEIVAEVPANFDVGQQFHYSNSGYLFITYIIERETGKSIGANLQEHIFGPAGMKNTDYAGTPDIISSVPYPKTPLVNASVAGAIVSTSEDMGRWHDFLQSQKGLTPASFSEMYKPGLENYGFGWSIELIEGFKIAHHSGSINGYLHEFTRFLDEDVSILFLSTMGDSPVVFEAIQQIRKMVADKLKSSGSN